RPHILLRQRHAAGNDQDRHILRVSLGDARKCVLDTGPRLSREHAVALAALDAAIAVGDADADAFLPAENRTDVQRRAGLDHLSARIARQKLRALALENFGNNFGAIHERPSPDLSCRANDEILRHYNTLTLEHEHGWMAASIARRIARRQHDCIAGAGRGRLLAGARSLLAHARLDL